MSEEYGWGGKILWVDLDRKQIKKEPIPLQSLITSKRRQIRFHPATFLFREPDP
jgi:hypothetical protein